MALFSLRLHLTCLSKHFIVPIFCHFRKQYKGYLLESRLHFRVHATRLSLSQFTDGEKLDADSTPIATPSTEVNPFSNPDGDVASMLSSFKLSSVDSEDIRSDEVQINGAMGNS